jgi:hypothetical protein
MWIWWCLAFVALVAVVGAIILTAVNSERQHKDDVDNIQRMHDELTAVATHLNQAQPDSIWIDKSSCYATEDKGFGYESAHICEARFELMRNDFSSEQVEAYVATSSTALKNLTIVKEFQPSASYEEFDKQIYPSGFVLQDVRMGQGVCGLVYTYTQKERVLSGQMYCINEVGEAVHRQLGGNPF